MMIDWSKAPEGFPLWLEYLEPAMEGDKGRRQSGGEWVRDTGNRYETVRGTCWSKPEEGFYAVHSLPAWNGEGLPPVGAVCEVIGCTHEYSERFNNQKVEIVAHHRNCAVFAADGYEYHALIADKFRPIRTSEQIAEDEKRAGIESIVEAFRHTVGPCTHLLPYSTAERLYEIGVRLQVSQ